MRHELVLAASPAALEKGTVLMVIRLPRIVLGIRAGASLGLSGAALQGLFRNPLAEPGLIGISSGAALFATATIVLGNSILSGFSEMTGYYGLMLAAFARSEEHTSELQSLMRISYAVFCLKKKKTKKRNTTRY